MLVCVFSPSIPDELLCAAEDKTILRDWFMTHTHTHSGSAPRKESVSWTHNQAVDWVNSRECEDRGRGKVYRCFPEKDTSLELASAQMGKPDWKQWGQYCYRRLFLSFITHACVCVCVAPRWICCSVPTPRKLPTTWKQRRHSHNTLGWTQ